MAGARRWGFSVPMFGISLHKHEEVYRRAEQLGYRDAWSLEVDGNDAFTPLAVGAAWTSSMRLGTAIASTFTRGPMTLAISAASMAEAAPGRFVLGVGSSSPAVVQDWNGIPFEQPYSRTRDYLRAVRDALAGSRVSIDTETTHVSGFRLSRPVAGPVPIYLAALRGRMLRLAGAEADGVIINWLGAEDVPVVLGEVARGAREAGRDPADIEAVCRVFVCVNDDVEVARAIARRYIAAYLTVPVYAAFHNWLGRGELLRPMLEAWGAGDRRGALAAIPDQVVDSVFVAGPAEYCRDRLQAYLDAGVQTLVIYNIPISTDFAVQGEETRAALEALAPAR